MERRMGTMSCNKMEQRILPYVDGRLKASEAAEVEKHLASCAVCRLRVNEFRTVTGLLNELPEIEPSGAFDARVHALVAAEPAKKIWWAWLAPSPRVAFAASMLLVATVWIGSQKVPHAVPQDANGVADSIPVKDLPTVEDYDVLSSFDAMTDLPDQPTQSTQPAEDPDGQQM